MNTSLLVQLEAWRRRLVSAAARRALLRAANRPYRPSCHQVGTRPPPNAIRDPQTWILAALALASFAAVNLY